MSNTTELGWLSWAYEGVNLSVEGTGGDECVHFIPHTRKIIESIMFNSLGLAELYYAFKHITIPDLASKNVRPVEKAFRRRFLLMALAMTFGVELGFKFATKSMIWILNPCHVVTMMQIFLLCAPPCRLVTAVFRVQMHCLTGATIALVLPIVNTRMMPFEKEVYYIQHVIILIVPFFLLSIGGVYTPEKYRDMSWVSLSLGILFVYHWLPLQLLAIDVKVNLNNMLCPAISDPFHGQWYRVAAVIHQTFMISWYGKLYIFVSSCILRRGLTEDKIQMVGGVAHHISGDTAQTNGYDREKERQAESGQKENSITKVNSFNPNYALERRTHSFNPR